MFGHKLHIMDSEGTWHSIDALNGKDGVWVPKISGLAVWEGCVWVAELQGALVLLCPV